jgi:hypothetical protein
MPVTVKSNEVLIEEDEGQALTTRQKHGRVRIAKFTYTAPAAHADGSDVELVTLPANRVLILGYQSTLRTSAFGSSRVGKVGHKGFVKLDGDAQAASDAVLATGLDLSSAAANHLGGNIALADTALLIESRNGVTISLTVTGGTIPSGATIKGEIAYVVD